MKVLKFGGTSIGNATQIKRALNIPNLSNDNIIVLSAFSGTTNLVSEFIKQSNIRNWIICEQLIKIIEDNHYSIANDLLSSLEFKKIAYNRIKQSIKLLKRFLDRKISSSDENEILAQGELLSVKIIYLHLLENNINVAILHALDFMKINQTREPNLSFIKARLKSELSKYNECRLFLTSGFICRNHKNKIDNLGRGGSDYTATIIGNAINASIIEIWTDIDGLHNNDPRFVENTRAIKYISYNEAGELAYFGAKVLHPSSITPAQQANIPVVIKNSLNPEKEGTIISDYSENKGIKAIAAKDGITTIKIKSGRMMQAYGFLRKIFEVFEKYETSVDMLTTSEISVAMTIDNITNLEQIETKLSLLGEIEIESNQSIICVVGDFNQNDNNSIQIIIDALDTIPIQMISFGSSKINISFVIHSNNKIEALNAINNCILENSLCLMNH
jgi:aspartate kinase